MTDLWQFLGFVVATVIYAVMLCAALHSRGINPFVPVFARLKKRHVEDILLVMFVFGAICAGGSKGTNANNRASAVLTGRSHEEEIGCVMRTAGNIDEGIRFSFFDVGSNAVHFAAFWTSQLDLPGGKIDLFAAHEVDTNYWELVGNYDITAAQTNLVDSVPLAMFPFVENDRLFLVLGTRVDNDGDGLYDVREKLMFGTSPVLSDTDGDGLLDGGELTLVPALDPLSSDTDGDGYADGEEVKAGLNPHLYDNGATQTIRYYYDDDDRLVGAYSGFLQSTSSMSLTPAGNPSHQVSQ